MFHKQIDELKVYSFFLFRQGGFEFMEMASEFGNTSNAGLELLRNQNKLGVWSLYQPDFIKAKRYIHKLSNQVPENGDLTNKPNILQRLREFNKHKPKIRLWNETDPVSKRVDCSWGKLKKIRNLCDVITPEGTTLEGNVKVFAKQKNCPKCGHDFKFQGELNRHVKAFHQELARQYVPRAWRGNVDAYVEQRLSCTYPDCRKGADTIFHSTSALNKHK